MPGPLLELNRKTWEVEISVEATQIEVFAKLIRRDLSPDKEMVKKEFAFLYFYINPLSEYFHILDLEERREKIQEALLMGDDWVIDSQLNDAINYYIMTSRTVSHILYEGSVKAAMIVNESFKDEKILKATDKQGRPIMDAQKLLTALNRVPKTMQDLKTAYNLIVTEQRSDEKKLKGTKVLNVFEDGFKSKD